MHLPNTRLYCRSVHPIERLRYVARSGDLPDRVLIPEAMPALGAFSHDENALLVAIRQLISRQPESPGLLCLGATMLDGVDAWAAGDRVVDQFLSDRTVEVAESIAVAEAGGTDVIDSIASGPGHVLCPSGTQAWMDHSREAGRSIVVVTPFGTRLPELLWRSYLERNGHTGTPQEGTPPVSPEVIELSRFDDLIDRDGVTPLDAWTPDCPEVAEIARR